ncbi:MAG: M23 family metallopeptidase [Luteimonas sp.]
MKTWLQGILLLAGALACVLLAWFALTRGLQRAPSRQVPAADPAPPARAKPWRVAPGTARGPTTAPSTSPPPSSPPRRILSPRPGPAGLVVPVAGVSAVQLADTFDDTRGTERRHEALDIMAPPGTPVLAVADGHVEKLFDSDRGGLTIYQFEPSGRYAYYYAHLQRYAAGLAEGQAVRQGQVIGYVGSTGNADPAAPHLHFGIFLLGPERQWYRGTPINPYPLLGGR